MPVSINGNGHISGLVVGGLPNGSVNADTLASNAVTSAKLHNDAVTSAHMPSNTIVQVVQKFKNDPESTSGNSHTAIPGLTVVITPSYQVIKFYTQVIYIWQLVVQNVLFV